ncbi:formin-like protein 5 [Dromiciops gliroides]|uniref:formin-like protein 5 n=1 Tax=Dromiciops gliroides TaxID=33562 RepID=UPI001CC34589|nr:formin-like protein 5 [Dromiciops gliroides]
MFTVIFTSEIMEMHYAKEFGICGMEHQRISADLDFLLLSIVLKALTSLIALGLLQSSRPPPILPTTTPPQPPQPPTLTRPRPRHLPPASLPTPPQSPPAISSAHAPPRPSPPPPPRFPPAHPSSPRPRHHPLHPQSPPPPRPPPTTTPIPRPRPLRSRPPPRPSPVNPPLTLAHNLPPPSPTAHDPPPRPPAPPPLPHDPLLQRPAGWGGGRRLCLPKNSASPGSFDRVPSARAAVLRAHAHSRPALLGLVAVPRYHSISTQGHPILTGQGRAEPQPAAFSLPELSF